MLNDERSRIASFLKNRGYYNFSINNIEYVADSTAGDRTIDLTMVVKPYMAGYTPEGEPIVEENRVYRLRDIYVFPGYDPAKAVSDSLYNSRLDTTLYRGLKIVYDARPKVRSSILRRTVNLYPNALYNESDVKRTYENIMRLGYYKSASVLFSEASDSAGRDSPVTYIGGPGAATDTSAVAYSSERYLDCNILCTPALRQSYSVELEGTTSSDYFGLTATLGYQNRNLFRGVELFDVSVRGGYEFTRVKTKRNSFELGVTTSFSFPRLITPLRVNRYNRAVDPRTKVEVSYSVQRRPYYHRALASAVWGYSWGKGRNSSFVLRPADISVVKLRQVDSAFLNSLKNPYLRNSYTSQLIAGLSGSYIFNNQSRRVDRSSLMMRFNFETNGNLIDGLSRLFGSKERLADGRALPSPVRHPIRPVFPYRREHRQEIRAGSQGKHRIPVLRRMGLRLRQFELDPVRTAVLLRRQQQHARLAGPHARSRRRPEARLLGLSEPAGQFQARDQPRGPFPGLGHSAGCAVLRSGQHLVHESGRHGRDPVQNRPVLQAARIQYRSRRALRFRLLRLPSRLGHQAPQSERTGRGALDSAFPAEEYDAQFRRGLSVLRMRRFFG